MHDTRGCANHARVPTQRSDPTHQQNRQVITPTACKMGYSLTVHGSGLFAYVLHRFFAFRFLMRLRYV
jgi:hypothetical protein